MDKKKVRNFQEVGGFFGFFYVLPIALLYFGIIPFRATFGVLTLTGLILGAYAVSKPITAKELGFRKDNLKSAFIQSGIITVVGLLALAFLWNTGILTSDFKDNNIGFYVYYLLISAPLQEFIFRSLVIYELNVFFSGREWLKILISALIFSLAHVMYHSWILLLVTFAIGITWGIIYIRRPNFYAVAASHMILGFATVLLGIV